MPKMNRLVQSLADLIRDKVQDAVKGRVGAKLESRFIFHGPPLDLAEKVFNELTSNGGIKVTLNHEGTVEIIPVLIQLPRDQVVDGNPDIGSSGRCDESHLLHIRNDPNSASFLALMPPGQHNNKSVESTTEEFGITASSNTGHASFENWWDDGFLQQLVHLSLKDAGIEEDSVEEARQLVRCAAAALDEIDPEKGTRQSAWNLLSRIFSISGTSLGLSPGSALALACGIPPMQDGSTVAKIQLGVLEKIAEEMADGFKSGVERLSANANSVELKSSLVDFLTHVRDNCEIPTTFERATAAYYLPSDQTELAAPPQWWKTLTCNCWAELLSDEPDETSGDLTITCVNSIIPVTKGMPAIVRTQAQLVISATATIATEPVEVQLTGGSLGKVGKSLFLIEGTKPYTDDAVPSVRSPSNYKVTSAGRKAASTKIISLASWAPGILITCRLAIKLASPRKPRRGIAGINWETSLSLPGSGRYELLLLVSPHIKILKAEGISDDATEQMGEDPQQLNVQAIAEGYQVEIDTEGKFQLDVTFQINGQRGSETCRAYITCEEAKEEGCKSEFERLIKLNRRHLEKFDAKAVIHLDRHARLSSLQSWLLDEQNVAKSFMPIVLADDYVTRWTSPDWNSIEGPILSQARFLHDPRPQASLFRPPTQFIEARLQIASRVRETSDYAGLMESAPLGKWLVRDSSFRVLVETYLDSYMTWLASDRDVACWVDIIAVCPRESDGRTLARVPDAIILSPLHPLRLAWHCLAQQVLYEEVEGDHARPCPAASILDPDCVPDLLTMSLQAPGGPSGVEYVNFLSVECSSDYWSVLWNGARLGQIASKARTAPFDSEFGLVVGGISSGFSPAQVARALEDVSDLLAAKPIISLVVSSAGGATDACNEGLAAWCVKRFGNGDNAASKHGIGPRILEVFDSRPESSRPDQATIANLSEDTANRVRWFDGQPVGTHPDLGIVAQLDSAQPQSTVVGMRSPLGIGGLIRHRVRRQLYGAFLSESRQGLMMPLSGDAFSDKVANCIVALESGQDPMVGLQFAPNVHAISSMLEENKAGFVAVSSSAIDPACFLGGWIKGTYLWDYDLPSYSHRAGDTSGYYLLSQVRDADRDALKRVLHDLPGGRALSEPQLEDILLEVARRGIPTVRGLSGDDTGATGDLGLFLAVRLLQDQFRLSGNVESLLPVLAGSAENVMISIIVPVDPFRGYLADLAKSIGKDRKDISLSRPDLLVVSIQTSESQTRIHLTPIEVKCRQSSTILNSVEAKDALAQARSMSTLLNGIGNLAANSVLWRLSYQQLLLSMISFGMRVYSQHESIVSQTGRWAAYHERIAATILSSEEHITIDPIGRLIVIDGSPHSDAHDHDNDGFRECIFISPKDANRIVAGDAKTFYEAVRTKVGDWGLHPPALHLIQHNTTLKASIQATIESNAMVVDASPNIEFSQNAQVGVQATSKDSNVRDSTIDIIPLEASAGISLEVGRTTDGFEPRDLSLNISDTRLNQLNIGVVGDLGTGKTQLLKSLIFQIIAARDANRGIKPRFLIFDYKRDYSTEDFVKATGAKVVRPTRIPLNLFDTSSMGESVAPWLDRFRFFADVLDKVYSGIGPVQRDKLKGAVRSAYETCASEGRQPTIYDIHTEYRELLAGKSDSPMAIIDDLVDMEVFERDPNNTKSFDEFFDGIVVISLDAMGQDDRSKNMLVAIMLNMFYENMLRTPKRPFIGTNPQLRVIDSYLLVDEADNIMRYEFDVLRKLLLQGREFGAGVILASQYLRHFKTSGTDYREPLLTWFIHKVPNVTPSELGALGFTADLGEISEQIKSLPNHHCMYKSFDIAGEVIRGLPFYEIDKNGHKV